MRAVVCLTFGVVAASCALTARSAQNPGPPLRAADGPYGTCAGKEGHLPATSCAAASCHGGPAGRPGGELTSWAPTVLADGPHDPHARAYRVLFNAESRRMAEYLDLGGPAHKTGLCLKCHAVDGAGEQAAAEGVGCGACHGPSERWLTEHYQPYWKALPNREKFERYGFLPSKNVVARVLNCAGCHVGDADREVNHDLIAAGHPRLAFEPTRLHFQPNYRKHWTEVTPQPDFEVRAWVAGQAAALRQAAELLRVRAARADGGTAVPGLKPAWPEFSGYSCYACHQPVGEGALRGDAAARPRPPGSLGWELWSTSAVRVAGDFSDKVFPGAGAVPLGGLAELERLMRARVPAAGKVRDQAAVVVAELDRWLARAEADEDDRPNRRLAGGLPQGLAGALAADALAGGRLKDSDWDYLAAHYLGCAAMAHAGGGASVVPWGGDVRGLEAALRFPQPWRYDSPVGFGPARLGEVRLGFEKLAKYQLSGAK